MKLLLPITILLITSCTSSTKKTIPELEKQQFFPVTNYIRGQLYDYAKKGINPLKYTTSNAKTDSVWLKIDEVTTAVKEFLTPEIDSNNLTALFVEKKFLDQTINTYTFTYEATATLPDSMRLSRWDVYIDPVTNNVKRIYLVKNSADNKTLQLTWLSNKWCKITTIVNKPDGSSIVEKEEKIIWDL